VCSPVTSLDLNRTKSILAAMCLIKCINSVFSCLSFDQRLFQYQPIDEKKPAFDSSVLKNIIKRFDIKLLDEIKFLITFTI
jgi:hypothetical protein